MEYKSFVSLNIAVIGEGRKAISLARRLAAARHLVNIGWESNCVNDEEISGYTNIGYTTIVSAATDADVVIIIAKAQDVREIAYLLDDVRNKIIIDATSAVQDIAAEPINTIKAIKAITGSAYVVKSFNCAGYRNIIDPLFKGLCVDSFVAGDSKKAKELVKIIARDLGYSNCYDFGDDTTIPLLEEMNKCWHNLSLRENIARRAERLIVKR